MNELVPGTHEEEKKEKEKELDRNYESVSFRIVNSVKKGDTLFRNSFPTAEISFKT